MVIREISMSRLIVYVHQVEQERLRDIEELINKEAKIGN